MYAKSSTTISLNERFTHLRHTGSSGGPQPFSRENISGRQRSYEEHLQAERNKMIDMQMIRRPSVQAALRLRSRSRSRNRRPMFNRSRSRSRSQGGFRSNLVPRRRSRSRNRSLQRRRSLSRNRSLVRGRSLSRNPPLTRGRSQSRGRPVDIRERLSLRRGRGRGRGFVVDRLSRRDLSVKQPPHVRNRSRSRSRSVNRINRIPKNGIVTPRRARSRSRGRPPMNSRGGFRGGRTSVRGRTGPLRTRGGKSKTRMVARDKFDVGSYNSRGTRPFRGRRQGTRGTRGASRGGRGSANRRPSVSKDDLDKQLEQYMATDPLNADKNLEAYKQDIV